MASLSRTSPKWFQWIGSDVIKAKLTWDVLVPAVSSALSAYSRGPKHNEGAIQPLRSIIDVTQNEGTVMIMPGYVKKVGALATKVLSLFPGNASSSHLPTHSALIILLDPHNGQPLALFDGDSITEARTAAASVVATKQLIQDNNLEGNATVAILGAGVQAKAHARCFSHSIKPKMIKIWSRRKSSSEELCSLLNSEGILCVSSDSIEECVKDADIINTCTLSREPILQKEWVKTGAHINCVGAPIADWQEIDPALMRCCVVYADSKESALSESGDVIKSGVEVFAEIGEVINGDKPAHKDRTTLFKSLGLAVEDAVAAQIVYDEIKNS